jgi:hypothetical protein
MPPPLAVMLKIVPLFALLAPVLMLLLPLKEALSLTELKPRMKVPLLLFALVEPKLPLPLLPLLEGFADTEGCEETEGLEDGSAETEGIDEADGLAEGESAFPLLPLASLPLPLLPEPLELPLALFALVEKEALPLPTEMPLKPKIPLPLALLPPPPPMLLPAFPPVIDALPLELTPLKL